MIFIKIKQEIIFFYVKIENTILELCYNENVERKKTSVRV